MLKPYIIVDAREMHSFVPDMLAEMAELEVKQIPVGDYILSSSVAVERKNARDFVDSVIRSRIFEQLKRLKEAYEKPVLVIEEEGLFTRNVDRRAVYGAIAAMVTDYEIPVIRTRDAEETAMLLYAMASREQFRKKKEVALRGDKPKMDLRQRQQFVVEGLPYISAILAKRLLRHFGSVENIMTASMEELQQVDGIGKMKARAIREVLESRWDEQ
ncbi:MAG: hypothetical protein J7K61_02890 [Thermoplasmata archaeon]|nr:hypothetical protein [Thermoplasmata archaeon]